MVAPVALNAHFVPLNLSEPASPHPAVADAPTSAPPAADVQDDAPAFDLTRCNERHTLLGLAELSWAHMDSMMLLGGSSMMGTAGSLLGSIKERQAERAATAAGETFERPPPMRSIGVPWLVGAAIGVSFGMLVSAARVEKDCAAYEFEHGTGPR